MVHEVGSASAAEAEFKLLVFAARLKPRPFKAKIASRANA
jgi:hypothetical protein